MGEWRIEEQQVKTAIDGLAAAETGDKALMPRECLNSRIRLITIRFVGFGRKGEAAQNTLFELFRGHCKCNVHIQIPLQSDRQKCQTE